MIPLQLTEQEAAHLALLFGCKLSHLPLKYLGVPLHNKKLSGADWGFVIDKVHKKLQSWKGNFLSIGGRVTLINSVLSAVPLYALSLYRLPKKIKQQLDKARCRFLWQGNSSPRKKYSMVN